MSAWIENGHFFCFSKALRMSTRQHWEQHGKETSPSCLSRKRLRLCDSWWRLSTRAIYLIEVKVCYRSVWVSCLIVGRLQVLVDAGIDVETQFYENGGGALHVLVNRVESRSRSDGFEKGVEFLCRHGTDINQTDNNGQTALELLCKRFSKSLTSLRAQRKLYDDHFDYCYAYEYDMYDSAPLEPSLKDKHGEERVACLLRHGARLPSPGRSRSTSRVAERKVSKDGSNVDPARYGFLVWWMKKASFSSLWLWSIAT